MPKAQPKTSKHRTVLGSDGKVAWLDLSDYLVHFARGADGYGTMLSILGQHVIRRGKAPFGCAAKRKGVDVESQRVVCLSEIPLGFLHRLVKRRRTPYGIAFHKGFVTPQGGAPLWYPELGTPQQRAVSALMSRASRPFDHADPIWSLTPFIDFASRRAYPYRYDFRWEREWRLRSDLHFKEDDVAFLLIPEELHTAAWSFFANARDENIGPAYFCPYIDPTWGVERVRDALKEAESRIPPPFNPRPS